MTAAKSVCSADHLLQLAQTAVARRPELRDVTVTAINARPFDGVANWTMAYRVADGDDAGPPDCWDRLLNAVRVLRYTYDLAAP